MQTWIVLGSSASAPFFLPAIPRRQGAGPTFSCAVPRTGANLSCAGHRAPKDPESRVPSPETRLITTNAGLWLLWPNVPDVYFLTDQNACRQYVELAYAAQARGTYLVTLYRDRAALKSRGVDRFDELICPVSTLPQNRVTRWEFPYFVFSGAYCLTFALKQLRDEGGGRVILIGCEGYPPGDSRAGHNKQHLYPTMRSAVEEFAEVEFLFCGQPRDDLPGMTICETPANLTEAIAT